MTALLASLFALAAVGLAAYCALIIPRRTRAVLACLDAGGPQYGLELIAATGTDGGLYAILANMEEDGLVTAENRPGGPERGGRPRRYYTITDKGRAWLTASAR